MSGAEISKEASLGSASTIWDAPDYRGPRRGSATAEGWRLHFVASNEALVEDGRERILDVAEKRIRRFGHRKTTVADIASDLGVSRANVYRFFSTKAAIDQGVCARIANRTLDVAREISQRSAPARINLAEMFTALHRQTQLQLVEERHIHRLFVAATDGKWDVAKWYFDEMTRIFEATIRQGLEAGELESHDAGNAARCALAAIISFVHPSLAEQRIVGGDDVKAGLESQARFVVWALAKVPG